MKRLLGISLSALLLVTFLGVINTSPISSEVGRQNGIEDLFSITEEELGEDEFEEWAIEKVKARILQSLHLKSPPKSHSAVPFLQAFHNDSWRNEAVPDWKESGPVESETINAVLLSDDSSNQNGSNCVRIRLEIPAFNSNEAPVQFWLYKKEAVTEYYIHQIPQDPSEGTMRLYRVLNQPEGAGWTRLDLSQIVRTSSQVLEFGICSDEITPIESSELPFAVVHKKLHSSRQKRATDCGGDGGGGRCCREMFYVSLEKVGWSNWIIEPAGYYANFCKGSCEGHWSGTSSGHAQVLSLLFKKGGGIPNHSEADVIHCKPNAYNPLRVIYTDESGLHKIRDIRGMSVSECGCV